MARIPDTELDRLKTEIALQRLAEGMGITLNRQGAHLIGLCPFHDDKEPSLVISPKNNLWHCLGACQCGGSVIDWTMKAEGVSFRHAVELLQADYQPLAADTVKKSTVQKLPTMLEPSAEDDRLLLQVVNYYHESLKQSPEALAYLEKRGLASSEMIDQFKIGFANRTLGYRLPAKNRKEGAAIRGQLQRLGLYRSSGHEHFTGSIVIPMINESGRVTEVYGRKINDNLRKGTPTHLYLPGSHAGIWNESALEASKEIILCESLIDALTFWCAGYRNVTASYGVEGFTLDHLAAFKQYGTKRVLTAYDRDDAGNKAAEKLATQLNKKGIDTYRIQFPKGMDANEYALQVKPASKSLGVVIRSAIWLGKGKEKPLVSETVLAELIESVVVPEEVVATDPAQPEPQIEAPEIPSLAAQESAEMVAEEVLPAAVVPEPSKETVAAEISEREVIIALGDRRYRIRGLEKNLAFDVMKVNLLVSCSAFDGNGEAVHVDTFDLYQQRPRSAFIKQAAVELGVKEDVIKHDLGRVLLKLESLQEANIQSVQSTKDKTVTLDDAEKTSAMALLQSPDLLQRITNDFTRCGVVGEDINKLVGYLGTLSRKLDNPLAITIQSTSAAGKSALMDAVLAFMPDEDRIKYSAMTGQSLFYMGETDLQHKVLAIVEEEGASNASYALKLLQSEGELTIASTGKDPVTGELKTQDYQVKGPVMIMLTTTAIDVDEELLNRCIVLTVDEGRKQTQAIHAIQRDKRTLQGLLAKTDKQSILALHQNAQRLLKPLAVVNPYAKHLSFINDRTRTRRDHDKYLTLIDTIALLHQHQRPIKSIQHHEQTIRYVEVTLEDIETANQLAHEVLGRTLDELPPQTRKLLQLILLMVESDCQIQSLKASDYRFSRRAIREATNWSDTALKVHLARLVEMEYLLVHRGGRGQSYVYELQYQGEGQSGKLFLMGLIDVKKLRYDEKKSGQKEQRSGAGQTPVRGQSGAGLDAEKPLNVSNSSGYGETDDEEAQKTEKPLLPPKRSNGSYRSDNPALVAKAAE